MAEGKHTAAPWARRDTENYAEIVDADGDVLAMVARGADADLIAEAPAMLEAITAHLAARDALADAAITSLSPDDPRFAEVARTLDGLRTAISRANGGR